MEFRDTLTEARQDFNNLQIENKEKYAGEYTWKYHIEDFTEENFSTGYFLEDAFLDADSVKDLTDQDILTRLQKEYDYDEDFADGKEIKQGTFYILVEFVHSTGSRDYYVDKINFAFYTYNNGRFYEILGVVREKDLI